LNTRHIRVLAGVSESNIDIFLKQALKLQRHFSPFMETIRFYGDTTSLLMMELLDEFNKNRRNRVRNPFYLTEASHLKDSKKIGFYAQLLRKYIQPGRKILHFYDTALPSYLMGFLTNEIDESVLNHPPVAALSYALAVLSTWRPRKREAERKAKYENLPIDNLI
jgi:hypothetical protein